MSQWLHIILVNEKFDITLNMGNVTGILSQDKHLSLVSVLDTTEIDTRDIIVIPEMLQALYKTGVYTLYATAYHGHEHG
jgi:hypothetical protein